MWTNPPCGLSAFVENKVTYLDIEYTWWLGEKEKYMNDLADLCRLPHRDTLDESRPSFDMKLRLSFVTELEEDEPEMNVLGSLTTLLKDLSNVKEILGR